MTVYNINRVHRIYYWARRMAERRSLQKSQRQERSEFVVDKLKALVFDDDHLELVAKTGELFPRGSLKQPRLRRAFSFTAECIGRFFTARLCRVIVRKLMRDLGICPILAPGQSLRNWLELQSNRLKYLSARSKRSTSVDDSPQPDAARTPAAMDCLETQPVDLLPLAAVASLH